MEKPNFGFNQKKPRNVGGVNTFASGEDGLEVKEEGSAVEKKVSDTSIFKSSYQCEQIVCLTQPGSRERCYERQLENCFA